MTYKQSIAVSIAAAVVIVVLAFAINEMRKPNVRSFPLRYLKGTEAADLLTGHVRPGGVEGWSDNAVFVRGSKKELAVVNELLIVEDVPKPQVSLRFQLIEADGFTTRDSAISEVESVLRGLFRFGGYRLAAEAYVLAKTESASSQAITAATGERYDLNIVVHDAVRREGKSSADIAVELFLKGERVLTSSVNVPDGQTIVIGTARPSADRAALILVVKTSVK